MQEIVTRLEELSIPDDRDIHIWIEDEHRLGSRGHLPLRGLMSVIRRCWTIKGHRPKAKHNDKYEWGYIYGAADIVMGKTEFLYTPTVSLEWSNVFLQQLVSTDPGAIHVSLLNSMLTSDISDVKVASAEALIRLGYHEGIAKLREMLKDKGKNGQMALDALARLGDREIIPDLVKMIKDEDPIVKKGAARALGSLGSEEEVPVLLGIIVSESDINPDAKDALIFIDRKLYCPFNWNNKEK
jgi:hypothetical protein